MVSTRDRYEEEDIGVDVRQGAIKKKTSFFSLEKKKHDVKMRAHERKAVQKIMKATKKKCFSPK